MDMHSYREALIFYDKALGVNPNELSAHRGKAFASHCINDDYNDDPIRYWCLQPCTVL